MQGFFLKKPKKMSFFKKMEKLVVRGVFAAHYIVVGREAAEDFLRRRCCAGALRCAKVPPSAGSAAAGSARVRAFPDKKTDRNAVCSSELQFL